MTKMHMVGILISSLLSKIFCIYKWIQILIKILDMRKAMPRDVDKKSVIPLPHPVRADELDS